MLGAVIGDIVGSIYEWDNIKTKDFEFFSDECFFTDDTVMTLAIAKAILEAKDDYKDLSALTFKYMHEVGINYPHCGYGGNFYMWMMDEKNAKPYNSYGNGSAMRVSSVAYAASSIEEVKKLSKIVTELTHNHKEGLKGAEATAVAIFLARQNKSMKEIKEYIEKYYYKINFTLDEIRPSYSFDVTSQNTVSQALACFFESTSFEDAIRNAISIGGDSDTLAAITGSIAEAYYGIPSTIRDKALTYLDDRLTNIVKEFEDKYPPKIIK